MNLEIKLEKGDLAKDSERGREFFTVKEIPELLHSEITFDNLVKVGRFILSKNASGEPINVIFNPMPTPDETPYAETIKNMAKSIIDDSDLKALYSAKTSSVKPV